MAASFASYEIIYHITGKAEEVEEKEVEQKTEAHAT